MANQSDNIIKFPNLIQLYFRRAAQAMEKDDFQEALDLLDEVLDLEPNHEDAKQLREALMEMRSNEHEAASKGKTLTSETLELWEKGLLQPDPQKQWQSFEKMHSFMEESVFTVVQLFLLYRAGDPLLKTKLLQQCKLTCPGSWCVEVQKMDRSTSVVLSQVPVDANEWIEEWTRPIQLLQDTAYHDPSLIQMAEEVWMFYLEKWYPFFQEMDDANKWTSALHCYTLKLIYEELSLAELTKLTEIYHLTEEEIVENERLFQHKLLTV